MNTPANRLPNATARRAAALSLAVVLTLSMLMGVNQLAVSDAPAALLAQVLNSRA